MRSEAEKTGAGNMALSSPDPSACVIDTSKEYAGCIIGDKSNELNKSKADGGGWTDVRGDFFIEKGILFIILNIVKKLTGL